MFRQTRSPLRLEVEKNEKIAGSFLERARKTMFGTVRVAKGVDLTGATGEIWDAEQA